METTYAMPHRLRRGHYVIHYKRASELNRWPVTEGDSLYGWPTLNAVRDAIRSHGWTLVARWYDAAVAEEAAR